MLAARASGAPLVVTAHGQDVANLTEYPFVRPAARRVVHGAAALIAVSGWLRDRLIASAPDAAGKTEVVDCGVDLERFRPLERAAGPAPGFPLRRFADRAQERGPARGRVRAARNRVAHVRRRRPPRGRGSKGAPASPSRATCRTTPCRATLAAADVLCQPSLVEPFGQAALEALACSRSVVATRVGGPPEFVPPNAGVLVDPLDEDALAEALRAASLPVPNPAASAAGRLHDLRLQAERVEAILERAVRDRRA